MKHQAGRSCAALAVLLGVPAVAETTGIEPGEAAFVHNPGFCDAPGEEQEMVDLAFLTSHGINSHAVSCRWSQTPQVYSPGREMRLSGTCDDGAETWRTEFAVSVNARGRVTVLADRPGGLPDYYFPCSLWGWKDDRADSLQ